MKTPLAWTCVLLATLSLSGACSPTPPAGDDMGGGGSNDSDETGGAPSDGSGGQATGGRSTGGDGGDGSASGGQGSGGVPATCGDGEVDSGEECDDEGESTACDANCTLADCGDGTVNEAAGEDCDDAEESEDCNADCTFSECGDGITNEADGEDCDDAGDSEDCNADCTLVECGDNHVNEAAGEECEGELFSNGNVLTINYCVECKLNVCGDSAQAGLTLAGEYACGADETLCPNARREDCDSGGVDTDDCDSDCTTAACGDGHWNSENFEDCDDGNNIDDDECSNACVANP